jgi:hypothetical protein
MELTSNEFINLLKVALAKFYCEDAIYPIVSHDNGKQERACSGRIAHFLQNEIGNEFIVDSDYEIKWDGQENCPDSGIRPDIIVHNRRQNEYYVCIEVKVDKYDDKKDFKKLEDVTKNKPDIIGIFLALYEKGSFVIREFKNGSVLPSEEVDLKYRLVGD